MSFLPSLLFAVLVGPMPGPQNGPPRTSPAKPDPFAVDDTLRRALGTKSPEGFEKLESKPTLPKMKLKGYLAMAGKPSPAVAIEIEGVGTYVARKDSKIAFSLSGRFATPAPKSPNPPSAATGPNGTNGPPEASRVVVREQMPIVLLVKDISPEGVVVEVGTLGETLVIR